MKNINLSCVNVILFLAIASCGSEQDKDLTEDINAVSNYSSVSKTQFINKVLLKKCSSHKQRDTQKYNSCIQETTYTLDTIDWALFDSLTIAENVMFPLRMFTKQTRGEMEDRVNSALKRVNLENAHDKMPSEASGGMQKRVAIARAIVNNPKYLFCDEPNSGLDPKTAIVIDNLIQEITHENNIVTVINTHDMNSVMEIGQNILFLKDGHNAWEGSKDTIFRTDNKVVTDFVYSSNLFKKVRKMYLEDH